MSVKHKVLDNVELEKLIRDLEKRVARLEKRKS